MSASARRLGSVLTAAILLVGVLGLASLGGARPAAAAPDGRTVVPCAGVLWGSCDTRATADGYQYEYRNGMLARVPVGATGRSGGRAASCGQNCPDDPAAVCDLYELVGPDPAMTPEQRAQFDQTMAGCNNYLLPDAAGIPLAQVQAELAAYLRDRLLPKPSIVIAPSGRSIANLATILYSPTPPSYTFNVDQPVVATISAVPHYHWDFGDGSTGPDAPGRPYDAAISPRDHPDAYVTHGYARPGQFQVTLTVTWNGTFTLPGVAQAFPLEAVNLAAAQPLVVNEASGVLVHND
ncbi:PDK repeat-containing protein [Frankia canadensis]|uniref:PDK repeat-containing protein n=1 Tax=Frankia canadensis TaxID=1836972 RepID=A0A2I2KTA7_9ACTN|nr:PKD domain-containing protein [Frankia canadensis]SNQ48901.1 PDK repeat-containing protein [Frankia canadensis]SOU56191.1 PDK repeat-containing protein [Frankia canadensis]